MVKWKLALICTGFPYGRRPIGLVALPFSVIPLTKPAICKLLAAAPVPEQDRDEDEPEPEAEDEVHVLEIITAKPDSPHADDDPDLLINQLKSMDPEVVPSEYLSRLPIVINSDIS